MKSAAALQLDEKAADEAAIVLVLRSLHSKGRVHEQPVEVRLSLETNTKTAVAATDLPANTLELPPCVPKYAKVHETSSHPYRVLIKVQQKNSATTRTERFSEVRRATKENARGSRSCGKRN